MSHRTAPTGNPALPQTVDRAPAGAAVDGMRTGGRFLGRPGRHAADRDLSECWQPGQPHPAGGYDEIVTDPNSGTVRYLSDGEPHRRDGPAAIYSDGTEEHFIDGVRHRDGGKPAVTLSTGELEYHVNGQLHRDGDLPALIDPDGSKEYWVSGKRHRAGDNPAVIGVDGRTEYWVDGQRHRTISDGPALIRADGTVAYFEAGREMHPKHV